MRLISSIPALPVLTGLVVASALVLGGETRTGFLGDVVVQAVAVPLLLLGLANLSRLDCAATRRRCLTAVIVVALVALSIFAVQLSPLPPEWWLALSRPPISLSDSITSSETGNWRALSLTPHATWAGAASLIVPFAVFLAVIQLGSLQRKLMTWVVLSMSGIALVFGYLQVAPATGMAFRFSSFINQSEAVGFFANRNHFAALLYSTLVLSGVWLAIVSRPALEAGKIDPRTVLWLAAALSFFLAIFAGLSMSRSRAGILLGVGASFGVAVMIFAGNKGTPSPVRNGGQAPRNRFWLWMLALVSAASIAAELALHRSIIRFSGDPIDNFRIKIIWSTVETALLSLPFGTGVGSFVPVYAASEKHIDFSAFVNRAHNDFAELFLETGALGILCILGFLAWFLIRVVAIWRNKASPRLTSHELLQRAATIVILLLLIHSLVDYPLRTTALSTLFAFCCALLIPSPDSTKKRQIKPAQTRSAKGLKETTRSRARTPPKIWVPDVELPTAWQKSRRRSRT